MAAVVLDQMLLSSTSPLPSYSDETVMVTIFLSDKTVMATVILHQMATVFLQL